MATTIFPSKYMQGPSMIRKLGLETKKLGQKGFFLLDPFAWESILPDVRETIENDVHTYFEKFQGECSYAEVDRNIEIASSHHCDVIVGVGGGKTLDAAKAIAHKMKKPVIIVPTIASTDAPCSALSVIYTEESVFQEYLILPKNPELVLVDSNIIVNSPSRFLVAGMGDALATWFEAESCMIKKAGNMTGDVGSMTAYSLANLCCETLFNYGELALDSCNAKAVTPAFEKVVEANILLSGLGFESGGLASCHAIHNGLTALEKTHKFWHGEKVAFGVATSMFLTDKDPEIVDSVFSFCESIGLPTTFKDLDLEGVSDGDLMKVAELACAEGETIHNELGEMTAEKVVSAMKLANEYGASRKCCE